MTDANKGIEMKIEKNIPMPMSRSASNYGWGEFEVGDCTFVEGPAMKEKQSVYQYGTRNNKKFTCRQEEKGVRIWRIE